MFDNWKKYTFNTIKWKFFILKVISRIEVYGEIKAKRIS
jgi:hypothetical protein